MLASIPRNVVPKVHFSGIGGTAMVAGARLALEAGWEVRGSDNPLYPPTSQMVAQLGVPVASGYESANLDWGPDLVIIGNALSRGNPEVEAALDRRLHYTSLPEWLKEAVLRQRRPVAICGTHGKTTTTALTAYLLDRAGLEVGFLVGGQPLDFDHSARLGPEGAPFVIEGDEYDTAFFDKRAKFFHYLPEIAVVTSVEFDHGDIYRDLDEIAVAFQRMLRQIPASGWLVACADDPGAAALVPHGFSNATTYGFNEGAQWRGEIAQGPDGFQRLLVHREGVLWATMDVPLAGRHNLLNTLAAVAAAGILGVEPGVLAESIRGFRGVKRRMEVFLEARGALFIDDFAHHPTAIRETIAGARTRWPDRRLRVLFEPRSNTTVTNRFQGELAEAFQSADEVWLGPLHRAEGIAPADRLDRTAIVDHVRKHGGQAHATDEVEEIVGHLSEHVQAGDIVLILSNGAFGGIYARLREVFGENSG
jgi:UDP-N-acetylmuramate: L-alanyl-gamma-D-glutamyl-meso-diaminopimelate ligase